MVPNLVDFPVLLLRELSMTVQLEKPGGEKGGVSLEEVGEETIPLHNIYMDKIDRVNQLEAHSTDAYFK